MNIVERLNQDMKQAMKEKDKDSLSVIRMVKASLQNESIKLNKDLSNDEILAVVSRELKQRKDSLQEFENAGRQDLVDGLKREIIVIEKYLPEPLTEEELDSVIDETIAEVNASSKAEMGKVMNAVMPKVRGRADGSLISKKVQMKLS